MLELNWNKIIEWLYKKEEFILKLPIKDVNKSKLLNFFIACVSVADEGFCP